MITSFFQQVFSVLTTPAGSLTYHLIVAFSVAWAFQTALGMGFGSQAAVRRMALGLGLLLGVRLSLFVAAGLSWQGLVNGAILLPFADRAATLLGIVLIIWLWVFPERSRLGDAAALLLGLLISTLIVLGIIWWSTQPSGQVFNGSWPDLIAEVLALALITIGFLFLAIRRPASWGIGLWMLGISACGHVLHLLFPSQQNDFAGAVRLAQMAAYPLLLLLPQRFTPLATQEDEKVQSELSTSQAVLRKPEDEGRPSLALIGAAAALNPDSLGAELAATAGSWMGARLALVARPPNGSSLISLNYGYDLVKQSPVSLANLDARRLPALAPALRLGRSTLLVRPEAGPDLDEIGQILLANDSGSTPEALLAAPLTANQEPPFFYLILLANPGQEWSASDLDSFTSLCERLAPVASRLTLEEERQTGLSQIIQRAENLQSENTKLQEQFTSLRQRANTDRAQLESLAAMVATQEAAQSTINRLQTEIEDLKKAAETAAIEPPTPLVAGSNLAPDLHLSNKQDEQLQGELRLALEEVAMLREALDEADARLGKHQQAGIDEDSSSRIEAIATLVQELHQPLSSIIGYTDFLMGESVGVVGSLQRKFLERIKLSSERMSRLMEDLIRQTTTEDETQAASRIEPVDLAALLQERANLAQPLFTGKQASLQLELPGSLPLVLAEPEGLSQAILRLLENAAIATPEEGSARLCARVKSADQAPDYVLVQVIDGGSGVQPVDLPRIFSAYARPDGEPLQGLGASGSELSVVKALVEAMGGRIWVDSLPDQGTTFSILLPTPGEPAGKLPQTRKRNGRNG